MSLRARIAAVAGLAVAIAVIAVAVIVYVGVRSELRDEVDNALNARAATQVQAQGGRGPARRGGPAAGRAPAGGGPDRDRDGRPEPSGDFPPAPETSNTRFGGAEGYVQLVDRGGTAHRPPGETAALPVDAAARSIARRGSGRRLADQHVRGAHLRVLTVGRTGGGAVQVARPLTEVDSELSNVLLVLALAVGVGIAVAVGLGFGVARTALAPIARFTRRTEALTAGADISERIDVEGRDELARLAASFNATLDALEQSVEAQRHLVADASHELRTPIASLRANIQVLEEAERLPAADHEALRADILAELDELTALVGDVVELARGAKPEAALDDVRLDELVEALVERARRRAGDGVSFQLRMEPTLVRGEPERIGRAVTNLLDNARRWSSPGAAVEVELSGGTLTVRDHGPGFEEADLPRVFERFYRAKAARGRPGSGLGLAIVRQAAEAHGGSVAAANAPGGGALLRVRFGPTREDGGHAHGRPRHPGGIAGLRQPG